ncbi:microfibril-associated glycoprotein 4-like [Cochliomyia hominivorax]
MIIQILKFMFYFLTILLICLENANTETCDLDEVFLHLLGQIENVKKSLEIHNVRLDLLTNIERPSPTMDYDKSCDGLQPKSGKTSNPIFDIRHDSLPQHCSINFQPSTCAEAVECTRASGIYNLTDSRYSKRTFLVYCDNENYDGDWLYILRRNDGSIQFNRSWQEYVNGFGNVAGEYWLGLENLYALTNFYGPQELLVFVENFQGEKKFARYDNFAIENSKQNYKLISLGQYWGTAGDSLFNHLGAEFSTFDRDNDQSDIHCALLSNGGFWFKKCGYASPTASYLRGSNSGVQNNIHWHTFGGYYYSHKTIIFMIRRKNAVKLE